MNTNGKNMTVFLVDGNPKGIIKIHVGNRLCMAYKIPRTELKNCKGRDDLKQSGVYFLIYPSDGDGKDKVYIGQADIRNDGESFLKRFDEHIRNDSEDDGYWTEAIVFTSARNDFGSTEISYLENRFYNIAKEVGNYTVNNKSEPTKGNITEEKICELEEFIDDTKIVMDVLGYNVFEPVIEENVNDRQITTDDRTIFHLNHTINKETFEADGCQTADGFVVLSGCKISPETDDNVPLTIKQRRESVIQNSNGVLQEDMPFTSPTYAAMFVIGKRNNGRTEWKTEDGRTLKSIEDEEIKPAPKDLY